MKLTEAERKKVNSLMIKILDKKIQESSKWVKSLDSLNHCDIFDDCLLGFVAIYEVKTKELEFYTQLLEELKQ